MSDAVIVLALFLMVVLILWVVVDTKLIAELESRVKRLEDNPAVPPPEGGWTVQGEPGEDDWRG